MRQRADRNRGDAGPRVFLDVAEMDPTGGLEENAAAEASYSLADRLGGHVVEEDRVDSLPHRRLGVVQIFHLDLHADQGGGNPPRGSPCLGDPPPPPPPPPADRPRPSPANVPEPFGSIWRKTPAATGPPQKRPGAPAR